MTTHRPGGSDVSERARAHFDRAQSNSLPVAALLVAIDRFERIADTGARAALRKSVEALVLGDPEAGQRHLSRSGDRLLVLCPGLALADVAAVARRLVEDARKLRVPHGERKLRVRLSIGVAHNHGRPELSFDVLLCVAGESLGVAQGAGGDRWVHTELYDLLQRRIDEASAGPVTLELEDVPAVRDDVLVPPAVAPGAVIKVHAAPVHEILGAPHGGGDDRVEILQRRIAKLVRALDVAEDEIARMRSLRVDVGIASIYRTVQGLAPNETFFDLKRQMMLDIFEANRDLRKIAN